MEKVNRNLGLSERKACHHCYHMGEQQNRQSQEQSQKRGRGSFTGAKIQV